MAGPKISIITVTYNSLDTIADTIKSVLAQTYTNREYIIIDGASTDGAVDIIKSFGDKISKFVSEPDSGIYDGINKGIKLATGDIVGILNADDFYYDNKVIGRIAETFMHNDIDAVFGDIQFIASGNQSKITRYYSSGKFHPGKFRYGYMPAHPTFYVRRDFFEKYGFYKTDYQIAADYELLIRFLYTNKLRYKYINMPFVNMRTGGVSTRSLRSNLILNKEILRACNENGIKTNYLNIYSKYFTKIFEFIGNSQNH